MIGYNKRLNDNGFSLIEAIIALSIFAVVLILTFSIYKHGNNSFNQVQNQSDLQWCVRFAKDKIQNEIKYSNFIEVRSGYKLPAADELYPDKEAIYVDGNGIIKHMDSDGNSQNFLRPAYDCQMSLIFNKSREQNIGDNLLEFTVVAVKADNSFEVSSNILLSNTSAIVDDTTNGGEIIIYAHP